MRVLVLGHRGLVGSAVCRRLRQEPGVEVCVDAAKLDLRDAEQATLAYQKAAREGRVDAIVLAAAKVGGIKANSGKPLEFIRDNLLIQSNVMSLAAAERVPRFVFLGSTCVYPREAKCPITETELLSGPLEPTNSAYAVAKIAGIEFVKAVRTQYGLPGWTALMPANLYGPGDNFDLETSHVVPALIRKAHEAARGGGLVTVWGTPGAAHRELFYVDDLAEVIARVLRTDALPLLLNVGSGELTSITDLVETIQRVVERAAGRRADVWWDGLQPSGAPLRLLDSSLAHALLGRWPTTPLEDGLRETYAWFKANVGLTETRT